MAILKHLSSKNSNYERALEYLIYQHDEITQKPILNDRACMIPREQFYLDGINCNPATFSKECELLNQAFHKNQGRNEIKSHHYIISFDPRDAKAGLTGKKAQQLGIEIVRHMRKRMDEQSGKTGLNFTLLATPAEGLSGRFVRIDRKTYGKIEGVTDKDYYTNSFHVPVYYPIKAYKKIQLEAPYHAFTNAGHISYVELDGDTCKNLKAFETVIRYMKEAGVGYGSVNHPVDRDPVCGYTGVIDDVCPRCGRREGEPVTIERLNELRMKFPSVPVPCDCIH